MNLIDQDCLPETLAFNAQFEAAAAARTSRVRPLDAETLAALRRNRLGGDAPPVRLPLGHDRLLPSGVRVRIFTCRCRGSRIRHPRGGRLGHHFLDPGRHAVPLN